jgi:hypothetical protein
LGRVTVIAALFLVLTATPAPAAAPAGLVAGSALASFDPRITVTAPPTAGGTPLVTIAVKSNQADDPIAKTTIYVPLGYQVRSAAVGTKIGTAGAHAVAADLAGTVLSLRGDLLVGDPRSFASQQARCVGNESVEAVWVLHLTANGQTLDLPVFVVRTVAGEAVIAQRKIVFCLPPPDVPTGTPGRLPFGAKIVDLTVTDSAIASPAATGEYRWRALTTPYTPGTGQPNAAGTREVQAIVRIPTQLTISFAESKVVKRTSAGRRTWTLLTITGTLSENLAGIARRPVVVKYTFTPTGGLMRLEAATTSKAGLYTKTLLVRRSPYVLATATIPARDLRAAGCTQTFAPVPCTSATVGGSTVTSRRVKVIAFRFR